MVTATSLTVRSGDTLSALAERHGVSTEALMRANGMDPALADGRVTRNAADPDRLMPGQQLRIPSATPGYETSHTVRSGDTLSGIAERWNVGLDDLLAANPQFNAGRVGGAVDARRGAEGRWDPDALRIGDVIRRPGGQAREPAPAAVPATPPVAAPAGPTAATGGRIDLQSFLDPSLGSRAPAAIVIGNAEGTRTANGGTTAAYGGHTDPGNAVHNQGSFSYQHGAASPAAADRLQLQRLSGQIPAYETAARAAGLDPNDARLASTYFDLYNQSPTAAARFLDQMPRLAGEALTADRMTQARVDAFVNPDTGRRFTNPNGQLAGGGFANIARDRLGRAPSEAEIQQTIRADQQRRTQAMEGALDAQGLLAAGQPAAATPTAPGAAAGATPWLAVARGELGTREVRGAADNARVVEYHATTSLRAQDDETSWCSSFVNWTMEQAGYEGTGSAAARSWTDWGQGVSRNADSVRPGDVIVFPRGSNPAHGHVAIISEVHADGSVTVVGGNQGNGPGQPDGVTESTRMLSDAIAVRRPTEAQRQQ